ncbi:MAG: DUF3849 domain-containing protein [Clostridia bacterium]
MGFETIEQWRQEFRKLQECRKALDNGDLHAAYEAQRPHFENYVKAVVAQFGERRVSIVLGHTVRRKSWDGRFTNDVKAWAERQPPFEQPPIPPEKNFPKRDFHELITDAHPMIVNQVCRVKMEMEGAKSQNMNRGDAR